MEGGERTTSRRVGVRADNVRQNVEMFQETNHSGESSENQKEHEGKELLLESAGSGVTEDAGFNVEQRSGATWKRLRTRRSLLITALELQDVTKGFQETRRKRREQMELVIIGLNQIKFVYLFFFFDRVRQ